MDAFSIIVGLLLGGLGAWVIAYLVWLLISPVLRSVRGKRDTQKFRRSAEKIVEADSLIAEKQFIAALETLKTAPLLDLFEDIQLVDLVREHHQNMLSRCVIIAEELQSRPENLPEIERLSLERCELLALYVKALDSFSSLKNRREKAGKDIPTWTKSDFETRIANIKSELAINRQTLNSLLDKFFSSIASGNGSGIVYH